MTTATLTRKIERVEHRLRELEDKIQGSRVSQESVRAGLELLHGLWVVDSRNVRDLKRIRRRIWSSHA